MSARRGAARRALRRIYDDPEIADAFTDRIRGLTDQGQIDRIAIEFADRIFQSQPQLEQVERDAALQRARRRREQAIQQIIVDDEVDLPDDIPDAGPLVPFNSALQSRIIGLRRNVMVRGYVYIIRAGELFFTLNQGNYDQLLETIRRYERGIDVTDAGSKYRLIDVVVSLDSANDWEVNRFKAKNPPRYKKKPVRRGGFFPYTHLIEDEFVETELAKYGLWKEVKEENYTCNCLVQSLIGKVSDEALDDIKMAVRNTTVPRKHLKYIGNKYGLLFTIHTSGDKNVYHYGDKEGQKIELCLLENHYFPFVKDTKITGFALRHWKELKLKYPTNWYTKAGMQGQGGVGVSSMRLLKLMISNTDLTTPIDLSNEEIWKTVYLDRVDKTFTKLEYPEEAVQLVHPPRGVYEDKRQFQKELQGIKRNRAKLLEREGGSESIARLDKQVSDLKLGLVEQNALFRSNMLPTATIFFDFESCAQGQHAPYLVAWMVDGEEEVYTAAGPGCAIELLEWVEFYYGEFPGNEERPQSEVTLIAHNVSYDLSFILEHLMPGSLQAIKKGSKFISASGVYRTCELRFKDSYKIIPSKLQAFAQMFHLPDLPKEVMPYDIFTHDFINGDFLIDPNVIAEAYSSEMVDKMRPNIEQHGCICPHTGLWNMLTYATFYCKRDVKLLSEGWNRFRSMTLEFFDQDINGCETLTTASLAFKHLTKECLSGVYSVSGLVLEFIRAATFGGQTQAARNESMIIEGQPIYDMDKVSLYPAAMVHMKGIPQGPPVPFYDEIPSDSDYFFVEIEVTKVRGPAWDFPLVPLRKEGLNDWTNEIEGQKIIIGKQTLEDLLAWHDEFSYTVLRGYAFNCGFNTNLAPTIQKLYDRRAELKKEKSPAQLIFKLIMNSSYGRTGLKPIDKMEYYLAPDKIHRFIANNYFRINEMNIMPNGDTRVSCSKAVSVHYNQQHIAACILETSKHLMRKVLLLQQRIGSPLAGLIFYTDTDSIHIAESAWKELEAIYHARNEELTGKALGQFHSDFELEDTFMNAADGNLIATDLSLLADDIKSSSLYSSKLYICGKKAYLDVLQSTTHPGLVVYHFRLKGITEAAVVAKCNESYQGCIVQLYEQLCAGEPITFTLQGLFKTGKDSLIKTVSLDRTVQFKPARRIDLSLPSN